MKGRYIHIFLLAGLMICGCSKNFGTTTGEYDIKLKASVSDVQVNTKASNVTAYKGSVPNSNNPLETDLWFSYTSGDYSTVVPTDNNTNIPCHTSASFSSGDITPIFYNNDTPRPLKYPTSGAPVYCVGLYPKSAWTFESGSFKASVTGEQDLMFAPEISGQWNAQFGSQETNSPKFSHILTWIKVVLCATSYEAIESWGKISQVTVEDLPTSVTVDNNGSATFNNKNKQNIALIPQGSEQELSITNIDLGEFLCAPAASYTFSIQTATGMNAAKTMTIDGGFRAGHQYVMVLYFNSLNVIDGVCTLTPWENQNDDLYLQ